MPSFTHRISNEGWEDAYLIDELSPNLAYSEKDGKVFTSRVSWLVQYANPRGSKTKVERIIPESLENK